MRRLAPASIACVVAALVAAPTRADVVMEPRIAMACPQAPSWQGIERCLARQGRAQLVRTLPGARLVHLEQRSGAQSYDAGVYLYVQRGTQWRLGGMFDPESTAYEVLDLVPLTIGHHAGYRLDVGQTVATSVQPDGVTSVPATVRMRRSLYCSGAGYGCPDVMTACDVLVRGQSIWSFRGTVHIEDGARARIIGDRRYAGSACAVPDVAYLGWPDQ